MKIQKEIHSPKEGLEKLLKKYAVNAGSYSLEKRAIVLNNQRIPLLPWRSERRFIEMKKMLNDGTLGSLSSARAMRTGWRSETLEEILYREIDLCLWITEKRPVTINGVVNGSCANVLMQLEDGSYCQIEAAAQLNDEELRFERHEVITDHGMATDQAIDTQIRQQSIYVFTEEDQTTYTDVDFELYGLNDEEIALVRSAFAVLTDSKTGPQFLKTDRKVRALLKKVYQTTEAEHPAVVEEEEE